MRHSHFLLSPAHSLTFSTLHVCNIESAAELPAGVARRLSWPVFSSLGPSPQSSFAAFSGGRSEERRGEESDARAAYLMSPAAPPPLLSSSSSKGNFHEGSL